MRRRSCRQLQVCHCFSSGKFLLTDPVETPEKVSYSTPTSHDDTTIPIVFTNPPPTSEKGDWGGKFGFSSLEEFRSFVSSKPPLFPEQNTTIGSPGGETQLSERVQRGNPNSSKTYIFSPDQDRENSRETLGDPLLESDGTSDTQSSKQHTFFRSRHMVRGVGGGTIFQVIPESEAQLLKPEAVRSFLGLEDRSHDVAEQLTTAIGILNSPLSGPEEIDAQLDHPGRSDNLARDLKALERGNEPDDQRKEAPSEQDQEMEDLKSNPIGVTYTESCISGISWNYSALFPKTTE